jgi:hypothetical protein
MPVSDRPARGRARLRATAATAPARPARRTPPEALLQDGVVRVVPAPPRPAPEAVMLLRVRVLRGRVVTRSGPSS